MPCSAGTEIELDCGEFAANMDDALALADRPGFEAHRAEARTRGKLRGLGFALFVCRTDDRKQSERDPAGRRPDRGSGRSFECNRAG